MTQSCDVAVVGGGPSGATAARLLSSWGFRAVLLEAATGPLRKPGEVLAPSARGILEKLELRARLDSDPTLALPCHGIASDWAGLHLRDFLREPARHGWIVDRLLFEELLADAAMAGGTDWRWGRRLVAASRDEATGRLLLSASRRDRSRESILAACAIDASGRSAALARRLGANRRIATERIAHESSRAQRLPRPGRAWIEIQARPDGWDYAALGPGGRENGLSFGLAGARRPVGVPAWEAGFSILDRFAGTGWIAAGDALAAFDPVTSQGLPQALASGLAAAHTARCLLEGDKTAADAYGDVVLRSWCHSLAGAEAVYASEQRWPDNRFWKSAGGPNRGETREQGRPAKVGAGLSPGP